MDNQALDVGRLRHPMERWLLGICIAGFIAAVAGVFLVEVSTGSVIASSFKSEAFEEYRAQNPEAESLSDEEILSLLSDEDTELFRAYEILSPVIVLLAPAALLLLIVVGTGREYGKLRANAVRITPRQFPEVYAMWQDVTQQLGIKKVPDLYTINGNGLLNAYASCVPGFRHFSAVYSDILETCVRNQDRDSLKFILGHEAGHIRLRHVQWWYLLTTLIYNLPVVNYIIGLPLSRAKEYGCDKVGHALTQDYDCKGLLMLTAGKHLYNNLDLAEHIAETVDQGGLWQTVTNFLAGHPILAWRVNAIRKGHNGGIFLRRG